MDVANTGGGSIPKSSFDNHQRNDLTKPRTTTLSPGHGCYGDVRLIALFHMAVINNCERELSQLPQRILPSRGRLNITLGGVSARSVLYHMLLSLHALAIPVRGVYYSPLEILATRYSRHSVLAEAEVEIQGNMNI